MKSKTFWIKSIILITLLAIESFFLTKYIISYVESEMFFIPPWDTLTFIAGLLLLVLYTYSLTIGGWGKWEQYILVPLPISIGIWTGVLEKSASYAHITALAAFLILTYDTYFANTIKDLLIYFKPRLILKFSSYGIIFVFSLLSAILVFLHSAQRTTYFNLGERIGEITQEQYEKIIQPSINENAQRVLEQELEGRGLPVDPEMFSMLGGTSSDSTSLVGGLPTINLDLKGTIENGLNTLMEPYKKFIPSLIALIVFALIRFLGGFVYMFFSLTIPAVFKLFKSIGFLHINYREIKKEEISFDVEIENSPILERTSPVRTAPTPTTSPKS